MTDRARRVLIVDDEQSFCRMLVDYLEARGHATEVAHDGLEGFRMATRGCYDVVVLDVNMPGVNGVETIRSLQMVDSPAAVVVVSGYITDEIEEECRRAGVAAMLAKPLELAQLGGIIEEVTSRRDE
jgi:CheY-like chemotaxis protein